MQNKIANNRNMRMCIIIFPVECDYGSEEFGFAVETQNENRALEHRHANLIRNPFSSSPSPSLSISLYLIPRAYLSWFLWNQNVCIFYSVIKLKFLQKDVWNRTTELKWYSHTHKHTHADTAIFKYRLAHFKWLDILGMARAHGWQKRDYDGLFCHI